MTKPEGPETFESEHNLLVPTESEGTVSNIVVLDSEFLDFDSDASTAAANGTTDPGIAKLYQGWTF